MNILYLADPSKKSHDIKWMDFFVNRSDRIFLICREEFKNKIDQSIFASKGIKIVGFIHDFSVIRPLKTTKSLLIILSAIKKYKIDVFHILYAEPNALWALFKNLFKCRTGLTTRGTDILVTIAHYGYFKKIQDYYVYPLYRVALRNFDFITCTSNSQKEKIIQITNSKVTPLIIRTGVNFTSIMKTSSNKSVSIDGKYILFPRTMKPLYNHEFAIKSLKYLNERIKSSYTFVFLDKDSEDSRYVSTIQKLINQYLDLNILFLDRQGEKSFCYLLKKASLIVITAKSDGSPVTAMEAMALGIPVILPPLDYDNDIFGDWIFKFDTWKETELASTIAKVLDGTFDSKIKMAKEIIFKYADKEKEMKKLLKLYS